MTCNFTEQKFTIFFYKKTCPYLRSEKIKMIPLGTPVSQIKHTVSPVFQSLKDVPDSDREFYSEEGWKFILALREKSKAKKAEEKEEKEEVKVEAESNEQ